MTQQRELAQAADRRVVPAAGELPPEADASAATATSATVIATTPSVVPAPSTNFSSAVIWSTEGVAELRSIAYPTNVAIATRLLRIGANIGAANRRSAFSRPLAIAPIP